MFMPPVSCESQQPQIEAREVAARWARLPDAELLDRLYMLGAVERRLVVAELAALGIEVARP